MKNLLYKELKLALHPTNLIFLALSAMLLIPNYPYYVTFFYTTLGIFFLCLNGRETRDIEYTLLLPVEKKDAVTARIVFCTLLEAVQLLLAVPFIVLHDALKIGPNIVGMDANIALLALAMIPYGAFNLLFFTRYYRAPDKVGGAFVWGSVVMFVLIGVLETLSHILPFLRDTLDTKDPAHMGEKLATLAVCAALFASMTCLAHKNAVRSFEKLDF